MSTEIAVRHPVDAGTLADSTARIPRDFVDALGAWTFDPLVVTGLVLAAGLYYRGRSRLRQPRSVPSWRAWCFGAGLAALAVALLSPIGTFDEQLFALHMTQHLLLVLVAAPLLLLGAPIVPLLWGLPRPARRAVGGLLVPGRPVQRVLHALTGPWIAAATFLVTLTAWHLPPLYDAAQGRTLVHDVEHGLFLGTALMFWWPVMHPLGGPRRLGYGVGILYMVPPLLQSNVLGALISLSGRPLYVTYQHAPRISPLSVIEDQQLGGLIMWVPGGLFWAIPFFTMLALFLRHEENEERRAATRAAASAG